MASPETKLYTPKQLASILNVSPETLRLWSLDGKLQTVVTKGGHRRYLYKSMNTDQTDRKNVIYVCIEPTVKSTDLDDHIRELKDKYTDYEVISDISFEYELKRKGLAMLLSEAFRGLIKTVVIRDESAFSKNNHEFVKMLFDKHGVDVIIEGKQKAYA